MKVITKQEAQREGSTRYFTGKACPHGHIAERLVSNGHCIPCSNRMNIKWKKGVGFDKEFRDKPGRKEKRTESNKRWRHSNPEKAKRFANSEKGKQYNVLWNSTSGKLRRLLSSIRARAKRRDIEFNLTLDDLVIPERCPVLDIKLQFGVHGADDTPSVDRIDNNKGYTKGNIRIISLRANRLKNNASLKELKQLVEYMETHFESK